MPLDLIIQSFNAGELSPHLDGRSDLEKYYSGCRILENMIPLPYGDAERRPGTYFVAELKDNAKKANLVSFQYSTEQAYIHEYGDQYIRFYKDFGQIQGEAGTEDLSAIGSIVAHWLLNDDLGTQDVLDDDAETHNGATETANTEDLHVTGKVGTGCFNLNGIDAVIVPDHGDFTFVEGVNGDFSLIAWIYYTGAGGADESIVCKWDDNNGREWIFQVIDTKKLQFAVYDEANDKVPYITADDELTIGWHLVVATYEGEHASWSGATAANYMTMYDNGVAIDSTAVNDANYVKMVASGADITIGGRLNVAPTITRYWPNRIDEVAVISKTLSAIEVASLTTTAPYEVASSYLEADLFGLQHVQSADVLYNVHGNYTPSKLIRYAHDNWDLVDIVFDWPPFLDDNITDTTITPTGAGAAPLAVDSAVTLTASTAIFTADHVGSYWLIKHPRTADEAVQPNKVGSAEADGFFNAAGEVTATLKDVKGDWNFRTAGTWTGEIVVERSYDEGTTWHSLGESLTSEGDQNFNIPGNEELGDAWLRARAVDPPGTLAWANEAIPTLSVERYYHYGIVKVTAFSSPTVLTGQVVRIINSESATKVWSEGAWSDERGYPVTVEFFEGRQFYAGTSYRPLSIWGSKIQDYENMEIGTLDDEPVTYTVDSGPQNMIRWMVGQDVLLIGTSGAEWKLGSSDPAEGLTPTNPIKPKRQTVYGSEEIQAILLANVILFVDRQGRRVRGAQYIFEKGEAGGYDAPDYTMLAEHITESGIVGMAYQQNPYPILWCWRNDGTMIGMVFEPGQKVWGWFRLEIDGDVESVAVEPGTPEDTIWIIVNRTINGATKRYIEYFKPRDWGDDQADCFFVDSGLSFDGGAAVTITAITKANPCVVTAANAFSDGDQIKINAVVGMTEVNNKVYTVSNPTTSNFELRDKLDSVDIDSTAFTIYSSGGTAQQVDNAFSGLDHLEGETVSVLGDGSVHADVTVTSGSITLTDYFNKVHVGLPYTSKLMPMKLEIQTQAGTTRAKKKRISQILFSFYKTLGAQFGTSEGSDTIPFRKTTDPMGSPAPLFTGEKMQGFPGGYELNGDIYVEQTQPLPMTVRSITPRLQIYG